jgi:DNA polymerase-4
LADALVKITSTLSERLERTQIEGNTIVLKVRFRDFRTMTRQTKLERFSSDPMFLKEQAYHLLSQIGSLEPIRLLGLGITDLKREDDNGQLKLDI